MIEDIILSPLSQLKNNEGKVMHMIRNDSIMFDKFGEIYFSTITPRSIKAWRLHKKMISNLAVIYGKVKIVVFDNRKTSSSYRELQEFSLGPDNYYRITIPPGIWTGFQSLDKKRESIIANCASIIHQPNEVERLDYNSSLIPYEWSAYEE